MTKKITLFFVSMLLATAISAQPQRVLMSQPGAAEQLRKHKTTMPQAKAKVRTTNAQQDIATRSQSLPTSVLLTEDFSKFTAGSEQTPDATRLDDADGWIADSYFNTPGWGGLEVFQAGGMAYLGFSEKFGATGMLITPTMDLSGYVKISLRARSVDPEGDFFNYNIVDSETQEAIDGNYFFITNEWTNVEFETTYGGANNFLYLFTEYAEVYVDDIRIESAQLETPTLQEERNVSATGFTASWDAVENAELYDIYATAEHAVGADGVCVWADFDFANMQQGGTEEEPTIDYYNESVKVNDLCASDFPGWMLFLPAYANGMVGVSGIYSQYGMFGYLSSPEMDLSGNGGVVSLSMRLKAPEGDPIAIGMLALTDIGYDFVDIEEYVATGDWQQIDLELQGGNAYSSIQVLYGGQNVLLIDDVKMTQSLPEGTVCTHRFVDATIEKTSYDVIVPERYQGDKISYAVRSVKELWENLDGEMYLIGAIESDYTEPRTVTLPTAIEQVVTSKREQNMVYDMQGRRVDARHTGKGVFIANGKKMIR